MITGSSIALSIMDKNNHLTIDDIKLIDEAVKQRYNSLQYQATRQFGVGDRVFFRTRTNLLVTGTITKINAKTIVVNSDGNNTPWKVTASFLSHLKED